MHRESLLGSAPCYSRSPRDGRSHGDLSHADAGFDSGCHLAPRGRRWFRAEAPWNDSGTVPSAQSHYAGQDGVVAEVATLVLRFDVRKKLDGKSSSVQLERGHETRGYRTLS